MVLRVVAALVLVSAVLVPAEARAVTYSGSLSAADGGLEGLGTWVTDEPVAVFSWNVTFDPLSGLWHYRYDLDLPAKEISHILFEVSDAVTADMVENPKKDDLPFPLSLVSVEPETFGGGNPDMPGSMRGLKFDDLDGLNVSFEFEIDRHPTWGDFYAKDGKTGGPDGVTIQLWNAGFADGEAMGFLNGNDPLAAIGNGSVNGHILVPDTETGGAPPTTMLPEPATLVGVAGAVAALARYLRRRR
jgi:hypothetical protein